MPGNICQIGPLCSGKYNIHLISPGGNAIREAYHNPLRTTSSQGREINCNFFSLHMTIT